METSKSNLRGSIILVVMLTILFGWLGFWILFKTGHQFGAYPFIPLYFGVFGVFNVWFMNRAAAQTPRKMLVHFMSLRMAKLLISILIPVLYGMLSRVAVLEFILTFLAFYLIYLFFEIVFFYYFKNSDKDN